MLWSIFPVYILINKAVVVAVVPFLASFYCFTKFALKPFIRKGNKGEKERHHLQDIVLIWQVWQKEDYHKGFMHGIHRGHNFFYPEGLLFFSCI